MNDVSEDAGSTTEWKNVWRSLKEVKEEKRRELVEPRNERAEDLKAVDKTQRRLLSFYMACLIIKVSTSVLNSQRWKCNTAV